MTQTYESPTSSSAHKPTYLELYGDTTLPIGTLEKLADTDPAFLGFELPSDDSPIDPRTGSIDLSHGTALTTVEDKQHATEQFIRHLTDRARGLAA